MSEVHREVAPTRSLVRDYDMRDFAVHTGVAVETGVARRRRWLRARRHANPGPPA